jgi:oligosaccharyltransferase complex subunit beta
MSANQLVEFVKAGGNVLVATQSASTAVRQFGVEIGLNFDAAGERLLDVATGSSDAILTQSVADLPIAEAAQSPVAFRGFGFTLSAENPLVMSVLHAPATAVSIDKNNKIFATGVSGDEAVIVAALQARNNARVVFSSSLALFSDQYAPMFPFQSHHL